MIMNPYQVVTDDGKMDMLILAMPSKCLALLSLHKTLIAIDIHEHEGWKIHDLLVDALINSVDKP